jgi:hypothetical protein
MAHKQLKEHVYDGTQNTGSIKLHSTAVKKYFLFIICVQMKNLLQTSVAGR